ncbi:CHAT domain-containing protein [Nodosilinea sp. AN01ver1]|uniref:CHAT domain-containing protein n=1 Tax=Nodosilinea sp. AN01ver1 TaxID=3423362 RepID=UPI003D316C25
MHSLGFIYLKLGQYATALDYYQRSLDIDVANGSVGGQALTLNSMAGVYHRQQQYDQAIDYNQQALAIHQDAGNLLGQVRALDNLGIVYARQGNYEQALATYQEALDLVSDMDARFLQASVLGGLGLTYGGLDDTEQAMDYFEQALAIHRHIGNPSGEALVLADIGKVLAQSNQPELAIAFYKQSVNTREGIRVGLQGLDQSLQQSYVDTVADTYRELADLLLQQDRVLEAQRVLDLLKVQELDDSLRGVRSSADTSSGVAFWHVESDLLALYEQVIADSDELTQLEDLGKDLGYDNLSPEQQQRLTTLRQRYSDVQSRFIAFLDLPEVSELLSQISQQTRRQNLDIETEYQTLQAELRTLPQETALLYPLILPDRLELVLVTADGPPLRYPINVKGEDLNRAIVAFGQALKDPNSDIQPLAQQLYTWLVAPLEQTLEQAGIESILYSPDGALRYVPLAALHDGEQYLNQRFSLSNIVAVSVSKIGEVPDVDRRRLLAAACAQCSFTFTVGETTFSFDDLPFTETEVNALAEQMPNTSVLLNQGFSRPELENRLGSYSIIHLATHGAMVENQPSQSFIVLGSEETVSIETIRSRWRLNHAELVVLSACETAVGSPELGSGVEILGLGYQIQQAGAQAVLASLWKVSDQGTQVLMTAFYDALGQGMTKAEALQAAQTALITGDFSAVGGQRATIELISTQTGQPLVAGGSLAHPYYWAPFILIGNGL